MPKDGKEYIDVFKNEPGGLHSEQKIVAEYHGRNNIEVKEVYTERKPCKSYEELLRTFAPDVSFSFQNNNMGRSLLQAAIEKFKGR
ncbi:hypothetical protein CDR68_06710 [Salmonella enterica]|nr:hypothetical protein [Salmonella enterica]